MEKLQLWNSCYKSVASDLGTLSLMTEEAYKEKLLSATSYTSHADYLQYLFSIQLMHLTWHFHRRAQMAHYKNLSYESLKIPPLFIDYIKHTNKLEYHNIALKCKDFF